MILRSPTKHENGGIFLHMVLSSTRHSRARGNPGDGQRPSYRWKTVSRLRGGVDPGFHRGDDKAWIPALRPSSGHAFAGMTEPRRPLRSADRPRTRIFEGEHEGRNKFDGKGILAAAALRTRMVEVLFFSTLSAHSHPIS